IDTAAAKALARYGSRNDRGKTLVCLFQRDPFRPDRHGPQSQRHARGHMLSRRLARGRGIVARATRGLTAAARVEGDAWLLTNRHRQRDDSPADHLHRWERYFRRGLEYGKKALRSTPPSARAS